MSFSVSSESIIFQGEVIDSPVLASFEIVYRAHGRHARSPVTFPPRFRLRSCHRVVAVVRLFHLVFPRHFRRLSLSCSDLVSRLGPRVDQRNDVQREPPNRDKE